MSTFDDLDNYESYEGKNDYPIWHESILKDENATLKWLNTEVDSAIKESEERLSEIKRHLALYKGLHYYSQDARTSKRDREDATGKYRQKAVVNHLYDLTEQRVSRAVKFKPEIAVLPTHDEMEDRSSAKVAKLVYDHISYQQRLDYKLQRSVRSALVTGEVYLFIDWNPDLGPEMKHSKDLRDKDGEIKLVQDGEELKDGLGRPKSTKRPVNIGDVELNVVGPHLIFPERKRDYSECTFLFRQDLRTSH